MIRGCSSVCVWQSRILTKSRSKVMHFGFKLVHKNIGSCGNVIKWAILSLVEVSLMHVMKSERWLNKKKKLKRRTMIRQVWRPMTFKGGGDLQGVERAEERWRGCCVSAWLVLLYFTEFPINSRGAEFLHAHWWDGCVFSAAHSNINSLSPESVTIPIS